MQDVAAIVKLNFNSSCNCMRVPKGGSSISGLGGWWKVGPFSLRTIHVGSSVSK